MMMKGQAPNNVRGLDEAVGRYGQPKMETFCYQPSIGGWGYFQRVCKKRTGEVLLVLQRPNGYCLLHTKSFYPSGAYRLLSGGIKAGEDLLTAVRRETQEETGLEPPIERFLGILKHRFLAKGQSPLEFTSYVFLLKLGDETPTAQDADESISGFREVPLQSLDQVAEQLASLADGWHDWGCFRARPHTFVLQALKEKA